LTTRSPKHSIGERLQGKSRDASATVHQSEELVSHKPRVPITILSVCIAVSTFVALQTVNQSLEHSLEAVPSSGKITKTDAD
jgi:hypothetical protein